MVIDKVEKGVEVGFEEKEREDGRQWNKENGEEEREVSFEMRKKRMYEKEKVKGEVEIEKRGML